MLRKQIAGHVAALFPGCTAEFVGQQSRAKLVDRTFGVRVKDPRGKYKSNIVWREVTALVALLGCGTGQCRLKKAGVVG